MLYTGATADDVVKAKAALTEHLRIHRPEPPRPQAAPDMLYFMTCEAPDFPVKIGISSSVEWRLHKMQTTMPYRVVLLGTMPGDLSTEKEMHLTFRPMRLRGEWFRRDPAILDFVAHNCRTDRNNATEREQTPSNVVKIAGF